jgi:hypothetical protein
VIWAILAMVGVPLWISDVFAWRGSPAAWNESLSHVVAATVGSAEPGERRTLRHIGDRPAVVVLTADDGHVLRVAAASEHRAALMGPFPAAAGQSNPDLGSDAPYAGEATKAPP